MLLIGHSLGSARKQWFHPWRKHGPSRLPQKVIGCAQALLFGRGPHPTPLFDAATRTGAARKFRVQREPSGNMAPVLEPADEALDPVASLADHAIEWA